MGDLIQAPMRTPDMVQVLGQMCREIIEPNSVMAELGCYYGESTVEFAKYADTVFAIDSWSPAYMKCDDLKRVGRYKFETIKKVEQVFDKMTQSFANIWKIKDRHEDVVAHFGDETLDLVYCDTIHSEKDTAIAIDLWTPKVKIGGYVSGHDYLDLFPGVKRAVDARKNESFRLWEDGNWAYRRM